MTPWQKIMRAYNDPRGVRGCRLTSQDVEQLGGDGAIEDRAAVDTEQQCAARSHPRQKDGTCKCGMAPSAAVR